MYYNPPALKHLVFFIMGEYRHELYFIRGVATIFQRGVTLYQTEGTHQIFISIPTPCFT